MTSKERFENDVTILRTSVPEDLVRAADVLTAVGISYRIDGENKGSVRFPRQVRIVRIDAWHEEAARRAVDGILSEFELPTPLGENTACSARTMANAYIVAIVFLVVAFLWWRFS